VKERKTSKGQIAWIIILTLLLLGNISYILYDKLYLDSKPENTKKKVQEVESKKEKKEDVTRSLSLAEQKMLLEQIEAYNTYLAEDYPISDISSFDNQKKLFFAYRNLEITNDREFMQGDLKKVITSYFGNKNNIHYEEINCPVGDGALYQYNDATRVYTKAEGHGHGGGGYYRNHNYYVDGTVTNEDYYEVKVHTIYGRYCADTCGPNLNFFGNAKDAKEGENSILTIEEEQELSNNDYEKVKEKLSLTTYTFQKDSSGNYGLVSVNIH